jgi:photosystem II stability/assembly factor-like uncharacterized protein
MQPPVLSPRRLADAAGRVCAAARTTRKRTTRIAAAGLALGSAGLLAGTAVASGAASGAATADATSAAAVPGPAGGPVPHGFQPVSMTFVSASEGWVLGNAPCSHKPCTSVVRTTDGGRSWVGIPAPRFPVAPASWLGGLHHLRFADPLDGFAFGSQLWVTHDGGASWRRVPMPGQIADLEASAGVVYAAVTGRHGTVTVYRSRARGGAWLPVPGLPARVPGYAALGTVTLHGTAGWVILGDRLYATQTGRAWVREPARCGFGMASVGAYDTRQVTLLCVSEPATGNALKILYTSRDGGAHFRRAGTPPISGDGFDLLAQPAPRHVFLATTSAASWVDVSGNGGRTWGQSLFVDDGGAGWSDFGFTTSSQGAAIDGNLLFGSHMYMTRDAGRTWHQIRF